MMSHDEFLEKIRRRPQEAAVRLLYANWLDEIGHPGAEYLRAEQALVHLPAGAQEAIHARERLWLAWATVEPSWLANFTQPTLLQANPTPFSSAWLAPELGAYRKCDDDETYCTYSYASLPDLPVEQFRGEFQWLEPAAPDVIEKAQALTPPEMREQFRLQRVAAVESEPRLPDMFQRFMLNSELQFAVRSPTGCSFCSPFATADELGSLYVTFFIDSQYCLLWDLYIDRSGAHCVIAHPPPKEEFDADGNLITRVPPMQAWFVAPSFEAFVYRVWLENDVWHFAHADLCRENKWPVPLPCTFRDLLRSRGLESS
jgi:uncharacterized protein (TIGR02996 family)